MSRVFKWDQVYTRHDSRYIYGDSKRQLSAVIIDESSIGGRGGEGGDLLSRKHHPLKRGVIQFLRIEAR